MAADHEAAAGTDPAEQRREQTEARQPEQALTWEQFKARNLIGPDQVEQVLTDIAESYDLSDGEEQLLREYSVVRPFFSPGSVRDWAKTNVIDWRGHVIDHLSQEVDEVRAARVDAELRAETLAEELDRVSGERDELLRDRDREKPGADSPDEQPARTGPEPDRLQTDITPPSHTRRIWRSR